MKMLGVLISTLLLGQFAHAADYCLAIRGNGELEPAHWGEISRVVEQLGWPAAEAGGSSGSITMFLIEGLASNTLVKTAAPDARSEQGAFLLKSLQGFAGNLQDTREWQDFSKFYMGAKWIKSTSFFDQQKDFFDAALKMKPAAAQAYVKSNIDLLKRNYQTAVDLGLISPQNYSPLYDLVERWSRGQFVDVHFVRDLKQAHFYANELQKTVKTFGSFNAQNDDNLFFRPGIVNFSQLAAQFGRIAEFYSLQSAGDAELKLWRAWLDHCATGSRGSSWTQVTTAHPECNSQLKAMMDLHFTPGATHSDWTEHAIGQVIPSFPITAILVGETEHLAEDALAQYGKSLRSDFGKTFVIKNPDQVRFGYWGPAAALERAVKALDPSDEKSRRFFNIGPATWKTALSLSPAEPGLSPFQPFTSNGQRLVSAGGWADLSPVVFLKATGCTNVVYITRRGTESAFAQGVAKRLMGFDRSWDQLATVDTQDQTSLWSRLYNLGNPHSSYRTALKQAAAVICSSWDSHEITEGLDPMIADAYGAPFYMPVGSGLMSTLRPPASLDPSSKSADGSLMYRGCF